MKYKIRAILFATLVIFTIYSVVITVESEIPVVDVNALDFNIYYEQWEEKGKIQFSVEGINITLEETLTKVLFTFRETRGRAVELRFRVPKEYMSPSIVGLIETEEGNVTINWRATDNESILSFVLQEYEQVVLSIKKTELIYGQAKKKVHDIWNYVEYNGDSDGTSSVISVNIDKNDYDIKLDNEHMIVQYKTEFFDWYYPIDDVSSSDIAYYYVNDLEEKYQVVIRFKKDLSGDVKIHTFAGASEGVFNWDAFKGSIAKSWISIQVGVKKALIDWLGDTTPNYE